MNYLVAIVCVSFFVLVRGDHSNAPTSNRPIRADTFNNQTNHKVIGDATDAPKNASFEWVYGVPVEKDEYFTVDPPFLGSRVGSSLGYCGTDQLLVFYGGYGGNSAVRTADFNYAVILSDLWTMAAAYIWDWQGGYFNAPRHHPNLWSTDSLASPGPRIQTHVWSYNNTIYLFGGQSSYRLPNNDLWNLSLSTRSWYWIGGSADPAGAVQVDNSNTSVYPGSYFLNSFTVSNAGKTIWLYGGAVTVKDNTGYDTDYTGDLWEYSVLQNRWTKHYTYHPGSVSPVPGIRIKSVLWVDSSGDVWIYGGGDGTVGALGDLWKFTVSTTTWAKLRINAPVKYPAGYNTTCNDCTPGPRYNVAASWRAGSDLYLFGGLDSTVDGFTMPIYNDVWRYSITDNKWYWMTGDNQVLYRTGVFPTQDPPGLMSPSAYYYEPTTTLYLFGGLAYNSFMQQDMWIYIVQSNSWTKIAFTNGTNFPYYPDTPGAKLKPSPPSLKQSSMFLLGNDVYVYSGFDTMKPSSLSMWSFNLATKLWTNNGGQPSDGFLPSFSETTWVIGKDLYKFGGNANSDGALLSTLHKVKISGNVYTYIGGGKNTINTNSTWPSARTSSASWVIGGQLWLYGGFGLDDSGVQTVLSDMWCYTGNGIWVLHSGSRGGNVPGNSSFPGARANAVAGTDGVSVWMYGGVSQVSGESVYHQDLWRYTIATSTWLLLTNDTLNYPENVGLGGATYSPGKRAMATGGFLDGNFYVYGGLITTMTGGATYYGDIWEYSVDLGMWFWIGGSNHTPVFADPLGYNTTSIPAGRGYAGGVMTSDGLYIYGGYGQNSVNATNYVNFADLWFIRIRSVPTVSTTTAKVPDVSATAATSTTGAASTASTSSTTGSTTSTSASTTAATSTSTPTTATMSTTSTSFQILTSGSTSGSTTSFSTSTTGTTPAICGNGIVEAEEQCDSNSLCCFNCAFRPSTTVCRLAAGVCDVADNCTGNTDKCPDATRSPNFVCSGNASVCIVCGTSKSSCPLPVGNTSTCEGFDECSINWGGCDYSVSCTIGPDGHRVCGPCPAGTFGSGYDKCYRYCGDGYCNTTIENCVTCPSDCRQPQCLTCGDASCDTLKGENCTTCKEDCGPCASIPCESNCNGHGTCDNGKCVCSSSWTGPTCSTAQNQPINPNANSTSPNVTVTSPGLGSTMFSVSIEALQELSKTNEVVQSIAMSTVQFSRVEQSNGNRQFNYSAKLVNGAFLNVIIYHFQRDTAFPFAGTTTTYKNNTLKLSILVQQWPFKNLANTLGVVLNSNVNGPDGCVQGKQDNSGSLRWFTVVMDNVALYGELLDKAVIDGRVRNITYTLNADKTVSAILPHFWDYADMDPNYSVLVDDASTKDACGAEIRNHGGVSKRTILLAVLLTVGGVGLIGAAVVITPKVRLWWQLRKLDQVPSGSDVTLREMSKERL